MLYYLVSNSVEGFMHISEEKGIYFSTEVNADEIKSFNNLSELLKYLAENKFFNLAPLLIDEEISEETTEIEADGTEDYIETDTIKTINVNTGKKKKTTKKTAKKRKK